MANILYLVHRMPYPPNKGDKVRSFHLLRHLSGQHKVFLGTFIDDPDDEQHVESLREWCVDFHVSRLDPRVARLKSLAGFLTGEALTLPYYDDSALRDWVGRTCSAQTIDAAVIFSSAMAQYVDMEGGFPTLVDFVDADSAKWTQYAQARSWPMSWVFRREGERLLAHERAVARLAKRSFFVTENEVELFCGMAPDCADYVEAMSNGVDTDFFAPASDLDSPYREGEQAVVFTGAMDYWPNVDAVKWFADEVLPALRRDWPKARFWIVGRSPTAEVRALAGDHVVVTGTVDDVRPYLMHAAVVVAPLRVARGIQNKILEAMAMERPVVASTACAQAVDAEVGSDLLSAESAEDFAQTVGRLLQTSDEAAAIGARARRCVVERYSWAAHLAGIDRHLAVLTGEKA